MKLCGNVKYLILAVGFFLSASVPIQGVEERNILSPRDLEQEKSDRQRGPALSSAVDDPNPWATFNQWMCFDAHQVEIKPIEIKIDDWKPWPQFTVTTAGQKFDLSPETDLDLNTEQVLNEWEKLVLGSQEICFYAAFLQYIDEDISYSLWVLEDIKTQNGYWRVNDVISEQSILETENDEI